jgi:hypothetical protein
LIERRRGRAGAATPSTPNAPKSVVEARGILHSEIDFKFWLGRAPEVDAVRPGRCPSCGSAARVPGRRLILHGHGLIDRQAWGPVSAGEPAAIVSLRLRRFRCTRCRAVMTVGPRDLESRRLYRVSSIAFGLALWAIALLTPEEVRQSASPWRLRGSSTAGRWRTLGRWVDAVLASQLFSFVQLDRSGSRREMAKRIARSIVSMSTVRCFGTPSPAVVFTAAAQLRCGASIG